MPEKVVVRQNKQFEIGYWATDSQEPESGEVQPVESVYDLSPYTMLLASLGACATIVVHTYALNHEVDLNEIELILVYERDEPENGDGIGKYEERISQQVAFSGDLNADALRKLHIVAQNCSIHHMLENGIEIQSELLEREPESV